jgi:hypothetical protein
MEPLDPELRGALKSAHPGLSDEIIDQCEALLAKRFSYHPMKDAALIAELDKQRMILIDRFIPHYGRVAIEVAAKKGQRL